MQGSNVALTCVQDMWGLLSEEESRLGVEQLALEC